MDTLALQKYLDFSGSGIGVSDLLEFGASESEIQSLMSQYSVDFGQDHGIGQLSMPKYGAINVGGSGGTNWTLIGLGLLGLIAIGGGGFLLWKLVDTVLVHPVAQAAIAKKLGVASVL